MEQINLNYQTAKLRVCVDELKPNGILGRVVGQRLHQPILFSDMSDFSLQIEAVLDAQNYPQAFQKKRSFGKENLHPLPFLPSEAEGKKPMTEATVANTWGSFATFVIHIKTRQYATWQGEVDWLDQTPKMEFQSNLELMQMINARFLL